MLLSIFVSILSSFINVVSHGLVILNGAQVSLVDAGDVWIWRVWVLNKTISRRVDQLEVEGEVATLPQSLQLVDELIDLLGGRRVELAALLLQLGDALDRGQQEALDCLDGTLLGLGRDLEVKLRNLDCGKLRLDD